MCVCVYVCVCVCVCGLLCGFVLACHVRVQDHELVTNLPRQYGRSAPLSLLTPADSPQALAAPRFTARRNVPAHCSAKAFAGDGLAVGKGEELAVFELGSTVVMVFEAPKNFRVRIEPGERVRMGQNIGTL